MRALIPLLCRWLLLAGSAIAAAAAAAAAPVVDARLAGHWQLDAAASDSFDTQLQHYLAATQQAQRQHDRRHRRFELTQAETAAGVPDELPPEPQETQRQRLVDALRPPTQLRIALQGDAVEFAPDDLPPSSMPVDEVMIRVDASGSAQVRLKPASGGMSLSYRYLGDARRSQQYQLDGKTGTLRVTLVWQEHDGVKFTLRSVYRRQGV